MPVESDPFNAPNRSNPPPINPLPGTPNQESVIKKLKAYIEWQRNVRLNIPVRMLPNSGPVSINLDLTSACNFSCPHCVDSSIINTGEYLPREETKRTIDVLCAHGLRSVILLGGGEPTLHKNFQEIIGYLKDKRLEIGIVTNGSRLHKVADIANLLGRKDWIRISIDAAREETFRKLHRPGNRVTLEKILKESEKIKAINPLPSLGYSFVIVWDGMEIDGDRLCPNIDEMAKAVQNGKRHSFDYISLKPCLIRLADSQKESLLDKVAKDREAQIVERIKANLQKAKETAGNNIKIVESVNLQAMLHQDTNLIKIQPNRCHMQFFRTVVSSSGIFHCPAFRGIEKARIAEYNGYSSETKFNIARENLAGSIRDFNAEEECKEVGCFYHHVNWWLEHFIESNKDIDKIEEVKDDNFFL